MSIAKECVDSRNCLDSGAVKRSSVHTAMQSNHGLKQE